MSSVDTIELLDASHFDAIVDLEKQSFPAHLQVRKAALETRLESGHLILGCFCDDKVVGILSYFYQDFEPDAFERYPKTLSELTNLPHLANGNTTFFYNLAIAPEYRGGASAKQLIHHTIMQGIADGCEYGIANLRSSLKTPSYETNSKMKARSQALIRVLQQAMIPGEFPKQSAFYVDPYLAFVTRATGCKFAWVLPHFVESEAVLEHARIIVFGKLCDYRYLTNSN